MKLKFIIPLLFVFSAHGQDSFQNLDFEAANISQTQTPGFVSSLDALPGWKVIYGTNGFGTEVDFNGVVPEPSPVPPWVTLFGTNGLVHPIEGGFSVLLSGEKVSLPGVFPFIPAGSISQTALVPINSQSIIFKAHPGTAGFIVSLGGQNVPFTALATGPNYILYGSDISAFAGQTLDLAFTAGFYGTVGIWIPLNFRPNQFLNLQHGCCSL